MWTVIPAIVTGRHPADEPFAVADWRRRVAQMYADVRRIAVSTTRPPRTPSGCSGATSCSPTHPASPLDVVAKASFEGLDVPHHDPAYRFECEVLPATAQRLDVSTGTDGVVPFERIGTVELGDLGSARRVGDPRLRRAACSSR